MTSPGLLQSVFAWITITALCSLLLALLYPLFRRALRSCPPALASRYTLIYTLVPAATATVTLLLLLQPRLSALLVPQHCHGIHCGPHALEMSMSTLIGIGSVTTTLLLTGIVLTITGSRMLKTRRRLRLLQSLSDSGDPMFRLVETPNPLACCAGLLKPQIFISRGLLESLNRDQLNCVLEHEREHARRRDNLRKSILHMATLLWLPAQKQRVRRDFSNDNERACDLGAAAIDAAGREHASLITSIEHFPGMRRSGGAETHRRRERIGHFMEGEQLPECRVSGHYKITGALLLAWPALILTTTYYGHPVLEWLSR